MLRSSEIKPLFDRFVSLRDKFFFLTNFPVKVRLENSHLFFSSKLVKVRLGKSPLGRWAEKKFL